MTKSASTTSPIKKFTKGRKNEWTRYSGARMKVFKNSGKEIKEYMQETGAKWRAAKDGDVLEVDHSSLHA